MAPKRSRSAVSTQSVSRKRGRGARGTLSRGRGAKHKVDDFGPLNAAFLAAYRLSRGLGHGRGRGRGRGRSRGATRGQTINKPISPTSPVSNISRSSENSSDSSDDSGPMSIDLGSSASGSRRSSDVTVIYDTTDTDKSKLDEEFASGDEPTATDKLINVVTGALPALRGELAAHVRDLLGSGNGSPLATMLRTLARFTTNIMHNRKKSVDYETKAENTTKETDTMEENSTNSDENNTTPVVSYLWTQSSAKREFPNSDETLVSASSVFDEASTSKCSSYLNQDLRQQQNRDPRLLQSQHPPTHTNRNSIPQTDWDPPTHMNRILTHTHGHIHGDHKAQLKCDPSPQTVFDHRQNINSDPTSCINENLTLHTKCDPEPHIKNWNPEAHMSYDPTLHINRDPTPQTNCSPTLHINKGPTTQTSCGPTLHIYEDPTPQTSAGPTMHINADPTPQTSCGPTLHINEDPTPQTNCGPTLHINQDPTPQTNCGPTLHINQDPTPQTNCGPTLHINGDPTPQTSCGLHINGDPTPQTSCGPTLHVNQDPTLHMDWDPTLDLTMDDDDVTNMDIDSMLRRINDITAIHEETLRNDDEDLDNMFPAVSMPQKLNLSGRVKAELMQRGRRGRWSRGRGVRARREPRERPSSPMEDLAGLEDAMTMTNDRRSAMTRLPPSASMSDKNKEGEAEEEEMGVAETYAVYKPAKLDASHLPCEPCDHPDQVVETASLSSVESADIIYKLSLPDVTIRGGLLSALQLEAVVYASQAHEHCLPDGTRAGFLIGDGAGVGKGRTIAGIIFENYLKGRKRAVWVSVSNDLKYDAERDFRDIGAGNIMVYPLKEMRYNAISSATNGPVLDGIVFCTYSSLIGFTTAKDVQYNTRLKQLVAWCGADFDGCIVFDECHRAKNLCPVTATKPSKTGLAVLNLQKLLPKARLVYASATGASEPKNMAYMVRLGIWGQGTPFPTFKDFLVAVEKRGVGAMEIVAMDMKLRGMYIARQLSFHGVTFKIEEVPLSLPFRETYDKAVALWVQAVQRFQSGVELLNPSQKWRKVIWAQFWGAHQRFFKYLCIAAKVSCTVERTRESLRDSKCVVIGLQSTGEARTLDQLERDEGRLTEFICTAKGVFQSLVEKHFPDPDNMKDEESPDPSPVIRLQIQEMKTNLLSEIDQLGRCLPSNTLDQLIDELGGAEYVAEMTGRKGRVVQLGNGQIMYESRSEADVPLETLNLTEKKRFMDGDKNIAIISEAASSGISLQSDKRVKNHKRRVHITLELPWSADRAIQQFGRTHRSNQVNAPEYIFLISDLAGERRFASTVAKRLESLGALTHGDRRATETRDLSQFNIENKFGRTALRRVQRSVKGSEQPVVALPSYSGDFLRDAAAALAAVGIDMDNDQDSADIPRFLNRLLGVPVLLQNALFQYFSDTFVAVVQDAKRSGRFDLGILDLGSSGERVRRVRCWRFQHQHATGSAPVELHTILSERGLDWNKADRKNSELSDPDEGFYLSRARFDNRYNPILCVAINPNQNVANRNRMFSVYRPNLGLVPRPETLADIKRSYVKSTRLAAMVPWQAQYEQSLTVCSHRYWRGTCNTRDCEAGLRERTYYVLSGSVLTVWALLEDCMKLLDLTNRMQVVRVKTDQGLKIVGTLLPKSCIELVVDELRNEAISFSDQSFQ